MNSKHLPLTLKLETKKLKPGTKEFKDASRSDKYFNALRIRSLCCEKPVS
jgi:hypothetical protein